MMIMTFTFGLMVLYLCCRASDDDNDVQVRADGV